MTESMFDDTSPRPSRIAALLADERLLANLGDLLVRRHLAGGELSKAEIRAAVLGALGRAA